MFIVEAAISVALILFTFFANRALPNIPPENIPKLFLFISNCLWLTLVVFLGYRWKTKDRMNGIRNGKNLILHARKNHQYPVINAYLKKGKGEFLVDNVTEDCIQAVKDFLKMQMNGRDKGMGVQWTDRRIGKTYQLVLMEMDDDDEKRWKEGEECKRLKV